MSARLGFARGCAWTGLYLSIENRKGAQVLTARVVLDPIHPRGPRLTVAGALVLGEHGCRPAWFPSWAWFVPWSHTVALPSISWPMRARFPMLALPYSLLSRLWRGLDGRYGWPARIQQRFHSEES